MEEQFSITQNGVRYMLFEKPIPDSEGSLRPRAVFSTEKEDGFRELATLPSESWEPRLQEMRKIKLRDNYENIPKFWLWIEYLYSDADRVRLKEYKRQRQAARLKKHDAITSREAIKKYMEELLSGKHPEAIAEIVKNNPLDSMTALSKLRK